MTVRAKMDAIEFVDLTHRQLAAIPRSKVAGGVTVRRRPEAITGLVFHQTAVSYGVSPRQIRAAGGDEDLAQQMRALRIPAHFVAFREGWVVQHAPIEAYLYHGNAFNSWTIGLELEGRYPGLTRDADGSHDELDEFTLHTFRETVRIAAERAEGAGCHLTTCYAHRQSSGTRRADPGEAIWRWVVMDYAVGELGLEINPGFTLPSLKSGRGRTIPIEWCNRGVSRY